MSTATNGHMKESAAWREVARRFAEREIGAPYSDYGWGLCDEVNCTDWARVLAPRTAMLDRIQHHRDATAGDNQDGCSFAFPSGDREVRVLAALFLALEAEEEGR